MMRIGRIAWLSTEGLRCAVPSGKGSRQSHMARAHMEHALTEPGTEAPPEPEETSVEVSQQVVGRSPWELFWKRFRRDKVAVGGSIVVIFMFLIAIFAPVVAGFTHGPNEVH